MSVMPVLRKYLYELVRTGTNTGLSTPAVGTCANIGVYVLNDRIELKLVHTASGQNLGAYLDIVTVLDLPGVVVLTLANNIKEIGEGLFLVVSEIMSFGTSITLTTLDGEDPSWQKATNDEEILRLVSAMTRQHDHA